MVSVRYRTQAFIDEGFYETLRLFADVVGAQERCEEVLSFIDACKADLEQRTGDVPEENKPAVYTGAVTFNGRHGFPFTYVNFPPFLAVHANNVADEFLESVTGEALQTAQESGTAYVGQNGFEVDLEQILQWDPDIIFLDPSNMDLVNDEYRSNPSFFDSRSRSGGTGLYQAFLQLRRPQHHLSAHQCLLRGNRALSRPLC